MSFIVTVFARQGVLFLLLSSLLSISLILTGCGDEGSSGSENGGEIKDSGKELGSFIFAVENNRNFIFYDITANISDTNINVEVPPETNITELIATFDSTGVAVKIDNVVQVSGEIANDFTEPLIYTVSAEDGTIKNYTVTVTVSGIQENTIIGVPDGTITREFIGAYEQGAYPGPPVETGWGINVNSMTVKARSIDISGNNVYSVGYEGTFYYGVITSTTMNLSTLDITQDNWDVKKLGSYLFITTDDHLLRSIDNGVSFIKIKYTNFDIYSIINDSFNNLYVKYNNKLWKSTDGGVTFNVINNTAPHGNMIIDDNNHIWFLNNYQLWKSTDNGSIFNLVNSDFTNGNSANNGDYSAFHKASNGTIWIGSYQAILGKSTDGGSSFTFTDLSSFQENISKLIYVNGTLWIGMGNGNSVIAKTDNEGSTFEYLITQGTGTFSEFALDSDNNLWSLESNFIHKDIISMFD